MSAPTSAPATIEAKWAARTIPTPDGHLRWTGAYALRWDGLQHSPGVIAFHIRTGRDPIGRVQADCGTRHCVQPTHVDDAAGRARTRAQIRAIHGIPPPAPACRRGHDQARHGRLDSDGIAYCDACIVRRKQVAA